MDTRAESWGKLALQLISKTAGQLALITLFALPGVVNADGGDFSLNFAAAAPISYDHSTGGGAWNNGTKNVDIVEQLRADDVFNCGDIITFLTKIDVDSGAVGAQTIDMSFSFDTEPGGQPGFAYTDVVNVEVNYNPDLLSGATTDTAIMDDGGSTSTFVDTMVEPGGASYPPPGQTIVDGRFLSQLYPSGTLLELDVTVDDLEASEVVVVRIDVKTACLKDSTPTGNIQGRLVSAQTSLGDAVPGGEQTVPLNVKGIITPVMLTSFTAEVIDGETWLHWTTRYEYDVAGLRIERAEDTDSGVVWRRVHAEEWLKPARFPMGSDYRLREPNLPMGETALYRMVEQTIEDEIIVYDELDVTANPVSLNKPLKGNRDYRVSPLLVGANKKAEKRLKARTSQATAPLTGIGDFVAKGPVVKLGVVTDGVQYLSKAELGQIFSLNPKTVKKWLKKGKFNLTQGGEPVAWTREDGGLLFYGKAPTAMWNEKRYYWLEAGVSGLTMEKRRIRSKTSPLLESYTATVNVEEDLFALHAIKKEIHRENLDRYYWKYLLHPDSSNSADEYKKAEFSIPTPFIDHDHGAKVQFEGISRSRAATAGLVPSAFNISVNGNALDTIFMDRIEAEIAISFSVEIPAHILQGELLEIELSLGGDDEHLLFTLDNASVQYQRQYRMDEPALSFSSDQPGGIQLLSSISNNESIVLLEISEPSTPKQLKGWKLKKGKLQAALDAADYHLAARSAWTTPVPANPAPTVDVADDAVYVVVTIDEFKQQAEALAALHPEFVSGVVTIESLYDHATYGDTDPEAIRVWLRSLNQPPNYVVILGKGHDDYRNVYSIGESLIPPPITMNGIPRGSPPPHHSISIPQYSDTPSGDLDADGLPELVVSRVPVSNNDEAGLFVDKVRQYQGQSKAARSALVADGGSAFRYANEYISSAIPGDPVRIYPGTAQTPSYAEAKSQLIDAVNSGVDWLHYTGHGGAQGWSTRLRILGLEDVDSFSNTIFPVITSASCFINHHSGGYHYNGTIIQPDNSLVESALVDTPHGIIASFAPADLSSNNESVKVVKSFYEALPGSERLGDAVLHALTSQSFVADQFMLIGDPALLIH